MPLNPCQWILTEKTEYFGKRLQNEGTTTLLQNLHSTQNHLHSARTLPLSLARMVARTNDRHARRAWPKKSKPIILGGSRFPVATSFPAIL
jgi:hypothetical protein